MHYYVINKVLLIIVMIYNDSFQPPSSIDLELIEQIIKTLHDLQKVVERLEQRQVVQGKALIDIADTIDSIARDVSIKTYGQ